MSKAVLGVIVAVIAIAALGGIYIANKPDDKPTNTTSDHQNMDGMDGNNNSSSQGESQQPASNEVLSGEVAIDIADFAYQKQSIKVKKGTKVTWTNQDSDKHDITPDTQSEDFTASELLGQGESYTVTFNAPGTFSYHCSPHPYMTGSVEVVE